MATHTRTRSLDRTRQTKKSSGGDGATASARKLRKPPLIEPFHVAVDRQLKSGHETYEVAEKAALEIKKRHPKLHVTVYDVKTQRHTTIEQPKPAGASNKDRLAERATPHVFERHQAAGVKH